MLKNEVSQNWSELDWLERARKNDPVDMNGTEKWRRMRKIFSFEVCQFQLKNGQIWLYSKIIFIKKKYSTEYSGNISWNIPQNILQNILQVANEKAPRGQPGGRHVAPRRNGMKLHWRLKLLFGRGEVWTWVTTEATQRSNRWTTVWFLLKQCNAFIFKC